MRVLLLAVGTRGDVQPFVAAGKGLAQRGHEVHLATAEGFASMAEAAGIRHHPLPLDFRDIINDPDTKAAMTSLSGKLRMFRRSAEIVNSQFDAMWSIAMDVAPDIILRHFKAPVADYAARRLDAPSMPVMLQPGFVATGEYPQFMLAARSRGRLFNLATHRVIHALMRFGTGTMMRRWRKTTDIDIGPAMDALSGHDPSGTPVRIHAYSPSITPRPACWPETEVQTGYLFSEPEPWSPSAELEAFLDAGPSPVYIGFGSMPGMDEARTSRAVSDALEQTGLRAVVATGWGGMAGIDDNPAIHVLDQIPHTWLFPRVSAVVHHGGSGTTHEGLRWGKPTIVCPLFADQPFFGQRVAELGAGPAPIPLKKITAGRLAGALKLVQSDDCTRRAKAIGEAMRDEDGVARLCEIVERRGALQRRA